MITRFLPGPTPAPGIAGTSSPMEQALRWALVAYIDQNRDRDPLWHDDWARELRVWLHDGHRDPKTTVYLDDNVYLHGHSEHFSAFESDPAPRTYRSWHRPAPHDPLTAARSDIANLSRFGQHVDAASANLGLALDRARVSIKRAKGGGVKISHRTSFCHHFVTSTLDRYDHLKTMLMVDWTPSVEVEPLATSAFYLLAELTPADSQLRELVLVNWCTATRALAEQLDGVADQLKRANELAERVERERAEGLEQDDEARAKAIQDDLLAQAGGAISVTEASKRLGVTRQALHKRLKTGSVLGIRRTPQADILVPVAQFVDTPDGLAIVDGLTPTVRAFHDSGAGSWSALQFLIEIDPLLGATPLDRLKQGDGTSVSRAVRAFLGQDHG